MKNIKVLPTPDLSAALTAKLLGQAIRARRTQSGLRLEDAAALCGVSKQTLLNIEHGLATGKLANVLQICSGLGITLKVEPWRMSDGEQNEWQ